MVSRQQIWFNSLSEDVKEQKRAARRERYKNLTEEGKEKLRELARNYYFKNYELNRQNNKEWSKKNREKIQARNKRQRDKNPEKERARKRLVEFNRNNTKRARSDGTVTKELLVSLYSSEWCHYCRCWVDRVERTIDHAVPLSRGGMHSSSNLVMSCNSCNSRKGNRTPAEFFGYLQEEAKQCALFI